MDREATDILISGGGVAGLTAAAAFGAAGFQVICVDPAPPVTDGADDKADLRTTAFLQPARALLDEAGLWQRLAPHAAALRIMRIVDAGGEQAEPRLTRDFAASELSDEPFGWNLPNWLLRREMLARLTELPNVSFRAGVGTATVLTRDTEALVTLSDGARIAARLLIAADGRDSPVRAALGACLVPALDLKSSPMSSATAAAFARCLGACLLVFFASEQTPEEARSLFTRAEWHRFGRLRRHEVFGGAVFVEHDLELRRAKLFVGRERIEVGCQGLRVDDVGVVARVELGKQCVGCRFAFALTAIRQAAEQIVGAECFVVAIEVACGDAARVRGLVEQGIELGVGIAIFSEHDRIGLARIGEEVARRIGGGGRDLERIDRNGRDLGHGGACRRQRNRFDVRRFRTLGARIEVDLWLIDAQLDLFELECAAARPITVEQG